MLERRAKLRVTSTLRAHAFFNRFGADAPCLVLNHSPEGACVVFALGTRVPNTFELAIGINTNALPVKVMWRTRNTVGVSFVIPRIVPDVIPG